MRGPISRKATLRKFLQFKFHDCIDNSEIKFYHMQACSIFVDWQLK